jgi:hypothetical protein
VGIGWMGGVDVVVAVVGLKSIFFVEMREPMMKCGLNLFKLGGNGLWRGKRGVEGSEFVEGGRCLSWNGDNHKLDKRRCRGLCCCVR